MPKDKRPAAFETCEEVIDRITSALDNINANLDEEDGDVEIRWDASEVVPQVIITTGNKRFLVIVTDLTGIGGQDAI
jgi:hypothetical protein